MPLDGTSPQQTGLVTFASIIFVLAAGCTRLGIEVGADPAATTDAGMDAESGDAGPTSDFCVQRPGAVDTRHLVDSGSCGTCTVYQCAPALGDVYLPRAYEINGTLFPGLWFEVPPGGDWMVRRVEIDIRPCSPNDRPTTIFAAITRAIFHGIMIPALRERGFTGTDTIGVALLDIPLADGTTFTVSGEMTVRLAPGWYALTFGTGAYGATLTVGWPAGHARDSCDDGSLPIMFDLNEVTSPDWTPYRYNLAPHFRIELEPITETFDGGADGGP